VKLKGVPSVNGSRKEYPQKGNAESTQAPAPPKLSVGSKLYYTSALPSPPPLSALAFQVISTKPGRRAPTVSMPTEIEEFACDCGDLLMLLCAVALAWPVVVNVVGVKVYEEETLALTA
jgi:hypothetical protein